MDKRQEARNLALHGQLDRATKLLDEVKGQCGANSASDIRHIGNLIAEKTAALREQERLRASQSERTRTFPSRDFVIWATADAGAIAAKTANPSCVERGQPGFGFCEAARPSVPSMSVRYWNARNQAFRYALATDLPLSCQDLGEHRQVRAWQRGQSSYELCELTERTLRNLSALLISSASGNRMYIFSQLYLNHDPEFEQTLRIIPAAD